MGWAFCGDLDGREIGYGISATCDARDCDEIINRGLGYICGSMHHDKWSDEMGCGGYFCDKHLGYVGERGGCHHKHWKHSYGKALCQPMTKDGKWNDDPRVFYCACREWESSNPVIENYRNIEVKDDILSVGWRKDREYMAHLTERNFYGSLLDD